MKAVTGPYQLRGNAQAITRPSHGPFNDVLHAQFIRDLRNRRQVVAFEHERRGPCRDQQFGQLRQRVENLLGQPVGEVLVIRAITHRNERQDRNRLLGRTVVDYLGGRLHSNGGCFGLDDITR